MTAPDVDLRLTPQRRAVLDVLRASADHPTAAEVFDRVRVLSPGIGAATVYRALGALVDSGQALELALGDGASARYDAHTEAHDHLVCSECGRAVDVPRALEEDLAAATRELGLRTGFEIAGYDLQFRGRCPDCRVATHPTQQSTEKHEREGAAEHG